MKAIVCRAYGAPELGDIAKPPVSDDGVLVRVRAASVNPLDWYGVAGRPYLFRGMMGGLRKPKQAVPGVDFAGTVEAVGSGVTQFQPGDDVFGARDGAFAEYVCVRESRAIVRKPANLTFEQAAAVPVAAITALQGLRDHGHLQAGQHVLINGASGGVGSFAVQLAKTFGAEVTGVCSTANVDRVRSLGADRVVDYTREDFTRSGITYDLLLDIAGSRSWWAYRRILHNKGTYVGVGAPKTNRWLGPLAHVATIRLESLGASQKVVPLFVAKLNQADMVVLQELLAAGKLVPAIDRQYALREVRQALDYLGHGHAQGKIVITV